MSTIDFSDLETDLDSVPVKKDTREKFPCMACSGTGMYRGVRVHQMKSHCFTCKGKGYFYTSPFQRQKSKAKRVEKKVAAQNVVADKFQAWATTHKDLLEYLADVVSWNDFARSLLDQLNKRGELSDKQMTSLERMYAKHVVKQEERKAAVEANTVELDLSVVFEKFNTAKEAGLKKPKMRLDGICFMLAGGRNVGWLYVKNGAAYEDTYLGKVSPEGKFYPARECTEDHKALLLSVSQDVLSAAVAYGKKEGQCSCCGRKLTNELSIELGIGPICRENWGL